MYCGENSDKDYPIFLEVINRLLYYLIKSNFPFQVHQTLLEESVSAIVAERKNLKTSV